MIVVGFWGYSVFCIRFVRMQYSARLHVDEGGSFSAVRVQVRRVKLLKNGGNDATNGVLVRMYYHLKVAVLGVVQVKIDLHFLGH
jgi:hypothetical protein